MVTFDVIIFMYLSALYRHSTVLGCGITSPGPRFNINISYHLILLVWATPMLKERRLVRRLSVNMGLPVLVRRHLYIETGPRNRSWMHDTSEYKFFPLCWIVFVPYCYASSFSALRKFFDGGVPLGFSKSYPCLRRIEAKNRSLPTEMC